jgi:hypothetical protein
MFFIFNFIGVFLASISVKALLLEDKEGQRMRKVSVYILGGLFLVFLVFLIFKNGFVSLLQRCLKEQRMQATLKQRLFSWMRLYRSSCLSLSCP